MILKIRAFVFFLALVFCLPFIYMQSATACGHNGVYLGLGYNQLFQYTSQSRFGGAGLGRVNFGPGFGGNAVIGYDFPGSRWGIQMPFEAVALKLNHQEWVAQIGSSVEGLVHLAEWPNGFDIHLVGGVGWVRMTEGNVPNWTAATGITASVGPGISYYFFKGEKSTAALAFEVPIRMVHYFGSHLSANGTTALAIPIRMFIQVGF